MSTNVIYKLVLSWYSMRTESNPQRLLVPDTAPPLLALREGEGLEGREEMPSEASGAVRRRSATARWGWQDSRLFKDGWLSVPNKFLRCYTALKPPLSSGEALFVLQLMTFKWDDAAPSPVIWAHREDDGSYGQKWRGAMRRASRKGI